MTTSLIIIGVIVVLLVFIYNGLVTARQRVKEAWSTVDTQLKRRYDLIPNLIETVKGYAKHERATFDAVTAARVSAMQQTGVEGKAGAENVLTGALKSVFAVAEAYPDLKANQNFLELQRELSDTETKIQASRQFYNTVVLSLNTRVQMFPSNIIAKMFSFAEEKFFELDEAEKQAVKTPPKVSF